MGNRIGTHTLNYGIYLGIFYMILTMALYLMGVQYFVGWQRLIIFVLMFGVGVYLAIRVGKLDFPDKFPFSTAFLNTLIILVIAEALWTILYWLLYNVINPDLAGVVKIATLENTRSFMEMFGLPEDDIEKAMDGIRDANYELGVGRAFLSLLIWSGVYTILSLIIGAIIKRKPTVLETES